ncbi:hypothetical protein [Nocardioides piscis]|uniref:hypothetical protein n=1 Tax=Nocardioides piscis TaxID=2714938 RepID=UPI001FECEF13|nr:hypothetical protein [Nocardioides piscis]
MTDTNAAGSTGIANLEPLAQAKDQKAWYWYDWANSAYVTTIGTVMFGPYFISLADKAAENAGGDRVPVLGMNLEPGSIFFWLITASTIMGAFLLPPWVRSQTAPPTRSACSASSRGPGRRSPR